jgi:uncharacterized membrane protein YraQ (UPF0718 family)
LYNNYTKGIILKKKKEYKGIKLLVFVILLYIFMAFFNLHKIVISLTKTIDIVLQVSPIFIFVILLTALINYFLKPKYLIKNFGKDSGKKGIIYALFSGIISHGPMYAWYGLIQELREKGVKDELLFIFFYARAIKIPMIPFSISVFGTPFTIIISFYILLFAYLQGKLFTLFNKSS